MLSDVGSSSKAHSACSPTPWEVTAAGSWAVDKAMTAELVSAKQASMPSWRAWTKQPHRSSGMLAAGRP
eukprot:6788909-Prymnesium_polylepis.1